MATPWEDMKEHVAWRVGAIVNYVITGVTTSKGTKDSVEGRATGENEQSYGIYVRRLWPFGLRSCPPAGSEGVMLRVNGGSRSCVLVAAENLNHGPTDLKEGDVSLFDKHGNVVRMDAEGQLSITSVSGARIYLDKDGAINVVPAGVSRVRLGDDKDAAIDPVVLFTQLKAEFDNLVTKYNAHTHTVAAAPGPTGTPLVANLGTPLTNACAAKNVYGKK